MKRVYFVRHAKSSWNYPELSDKERPLNERGQRDAPKMAAFISNMVQCPDTFISSPAVRAFTTAEFFASAFGVRQIDNEEQLYHASEIEWFSVLKKIENQCNSAMVFGHNPAITEVVNILSDSNIMNIPTCGIAAIRFETEYWKDIFDVEAELEFYHFPKGI